MNERGTFWYALPAIAFIAAMTAAALLMGCSQDVTPDRRAPGQPLDAHEVVEYDRPAWLPECERCYKVVDRQGGWSCWLLKVDGQWVTLRGDGE